MTTQQKKEYAQRLLDNGDKRSWNEIMADLELQLWKERFK
jgi:hypothetical protein